MKVVWFLLGAAIIFGQIFIVFYFTKSLMLTRGKWEAHPCQLPTNLDLANVGKVWQCRCGRRWRYLKTEQNYPYNKNIWEERTPEKELAEAEARLRKLDKEKS